MEQPAAHRHVVGRRALVRSAVAGALVVVALVVLAAAANALLDRSAPRPGPPPRVFAFLSGAGRAELDDLRRYGARIDVVAPNWYGLQLRTLTLAGAPDQRVVDLAGASGAQLWPVVNATLAGGDPFAAAAARRQIVDAIAAEVARRGYAGITLDVEQLPVGQSAAYSRLVRLLATRLHSRGERLAVYVPRRTADGGDGAYDWRTLAAAADLLIASGYNEHSAAGSPGPVTTAGGFQQMLQYAAGVSRQAVAPTIGAFGYSWPATGGRGVLVSTVAAEQLRRRFGAPLHGAGGDAYFFAAGRVVHYQSAAALVARARDARDAGMRWLALFSLGREPQALWSQVTTARSASGG